MKTLWTLTLTAVALFVSTLGSAQDSELVDRILAVVDEDPILDSDLDRLVGLGLVERAEDESDAAFRRRVLDQAIEEKLRFHEIDRFGFAEISLEEVETAYQEVRSRFGGELGFQTRLEQLGLTSEEIRQIVARQLMVLTYVDERLGPRVFVTSEEIEQYYLEVLRPELQAQGAEIAELAEVREQIRSVVKQQRLDEEIERWTLELRQEADIEDYFDDVSESVEPPAASAGDS